MQKTKSVRILRQAMAILIVLSVTLLLWQYFGMVQVFRIDSSKPSAFMAVDDRTQGGQSVAELGKLNNAIIMKCQIIKSVYQWPYCQIRIKIAQMPAGVDLSGFDHVVFNLSRQGPGPEKVRIYLNNFEAQSTIDDTTSLKVNELLLDVKGAPPRALPLNLFHIASWWVEYKNVPLLDTDMRIDNVPVIEISTPGFAPEGNHTIIFRSIEFYGKWISQTHLLFGIVATWITFCLAWLTFELVLHRQHLRLERLQQRDLETINRVLEIQAGVLSSKAQMDPLTGALNREGLKDFFAKEWPGVIPKDAVLSIMFADLDHFKRINDTYGHGIGDEVLQQFAVLVKSKIRKTDGFVRWGGEEFLIACPNMPSELAAKLAENIRASFVDTVWPHSITVTCSCGVATRNYDEDFGLLIERADVALYRAKNGGRNRVELG